MLTLIEGFLTPSI